MIGTTTKKVNVYGMHGSDFHGGKRYVGILLIIRTTCKGNNSWPHTFDTYTVFNNSKKCPINKFGQNLFPIAAISFFLTEEIIKNQICICLSRS